MKSTYVVSSYDFGEKILNREFLNKDEAEKCAEKFSIEHPEVFVDVTEMKGKKKINRWSYQTTDIDML